MKTLRIAGWIVVVSMVLLAWCPWEARAVDYNYWQDNTVGNWTNIAYWSLGAEPATAVYAYMSNGVITVDHSAECGQFYMAQGAGNSATCTVTSAGELYCYNGFHVGVNGQAELNVSGGSLEGDFSPSFIGESSTGVGTLTQTGGTIDAYTMTVGSSGTGTFNLQAGLYFHNGATYIGSNDGSSGTVIQTGGTNLHFTGTQDINLYIGSGTSTGIGYYEISGGRLDCNGWRDGVINVGGNNDLGPGTLKVIGTNAVITTEIYNQYAQGTLHLVLGAGGISPIDVEDSGGDLPATATLDGTLTVDFGDYNTIASTVTVINADSALIGTFSTTNWIYNDAIKHAAVTYDAVNHRVLLTDLKGPQGTIVSVR